MTSRPSTAAPFLAVLAVVLVTLGVYVGGYFWFGRESHLWDYFGPADDMPDIVREFNDPWVRDLYKPAGRMESWVRGKDVALYIHRRRSP
jgi:hypothetical protein